MKHAGKPFKKIEEQIEILESRGIVFSDKDIAARFLLRENYYAVVNGYKDAFLDRQASNIANEDRYLKGTPFEALMLAYVNDRILRQATMSALLEAEANLKTSLVYAFCLVHSGAEDYLDPACYCSKSDYKPQTRYTKGLIRLLSTLQSIRDNKMHKNYIEHYVKEYGYLPLWVVSKCITFGTASAFFDYQSQSVKTRACVALSEALSKDVIKQRSLAYAFHTLPEFRNICAHEERLYCAKVGKNGDKGFSELLRALETALSKWRYDATSKRSLTY